MKHLGTSTWPALGVAHLAAILLIAPAKADTIALKSGVVYRGTYDRDNTIVFIDDGLKRIILRDTKIAKIDSDASTRHQETFKLVQPLEVHGLDMPTYAIGIDAGPWDATGKRMFRYIGPKSTKPVTMKQAIIELGPRTVTLRGIDGSWRAKLATSQVPKEIVLGILAKVDQKNLNERKRVESFLIQAEWYPEALTELNKLLKDFSEPELREQLDVVRQSIQQLAAEQAQSEVDIRRKAEQPKEVLARLKAFPTEGVPSALLVKVRDQLREEETQEAADKALANDLQAAAESLTAESRRVWKPALLEMLTGLAEAPDAVRSRFESFQKAASSDPPAERFARAASGWVLGSDAAVSDLASAETLWKARRSIDEYLRASTTEQLRNDLLASLQALEWTDATNAKRKIDPETATRLVQLMPPSAETSAKPGEPKIYQVPTDGHDVATEYMVLLPPEYHPLRSYPAIVALHSGLGQTAAERMERALAWWAPEAARRGYIVIVPEYNLPDKPADYRYTPDEHAAVELALRDARRRFAIDSDRVFLGGVLIGGNMAWDYGLAHPDLFAGVAVVSGLPAKYVMRYWNHAERLPFYIAMGDLAPGATDLILNLVKSMLGKNFDVTYADYYHRGLEDLPEEAGPIFDWFDHRKPRDAHPKKFEVVTARVCDTRFYGVVVGHYPPPPPGHFEPGEGEYGQRRPSGRTLSRITAPGVVDALGQNLNPATIEVQTVTMSNLVKVNANGVQKLDVWVSPKLIDFKKRLEVRINGRAYFKGPIKPDLAPFLEDLRVRGDRQQTYWLKVSAG
jgi:predicted esterase